MLLTSVSSWIDDENYQNRHRHLEFSKMWSPTSVTDIYVADSDISVVPYEVTVRSK